MNDENKLHIRAAEISGIIRSEYKEQNMAFESYLMLLIDRGDYDGLKSLLPTSVYEKIRELLITKIRSGSKDIDDSEMAELNTLCNENSTSLQENTNESTIETAIDKINQNRSCRNSTSKGCDTIETSKTLSGFKDHIKRESSLVDTELVVNKAIPASLLPREPSKAVSYDVENNLTFLNKLSAVTENKEETVDDKMDLIVDTLKTSQVLIIQGNTGCGKTTRIPRYLLKHYKNIICTQPRRIAAINVARKVASDMKVKLGTLVGYAVRFDDVSSSNTRLNFVTDGVLLRQIYSDKMFSKYDMVIVDEAHERTVNIDVILGYCKRLIEHRKDIRIIIMSATLNVDKFIAFFNCPMIEIKHKVHPLENFYLKHESKETPLYEALRTAVQIHESEDKGDILVFLTGQEEIEQGYKILTSKIDNAEVLKLYSSMTPEQQDLVFSNYKVRKIILSTNIAETSVTIENVKYVVDCGLVKQKRFCPEAGIDILEIVPISKAQAKQRSGRAGRTGPGKCFRTYTKKQYKALEENQDPEILRTNLANLVILLKSIGIDDLYNFDFIDMPKKESICQALQFLYYLKAIDFNGKITRIGIRMANIPLAPELSLSLITASKLKCLNEVAIISAMLSVYPIWIEIDNRSPNYSAYTATKASYKHDRGDHFSLLRIYNDWEKGHFSYKFARKRFLKYTSLDQARRIKTQLCSMFKYSSSCDEELITEAFCSGYFMNVARYTSNGYLSVYNNALCYVHPSSSLYDKNHKYLLYYSLLRTRKEFLNLCMVVTPELLLKASNNFYATKK